MTLRNLAIWLFCAHRHVAWIAYPVAIGIVWVLR